MKLSEIESQIYTGDAMLVDGKAPGLDNVISNLIEDGEELFIKDGSFSHAGVFFRLDAELAEMLGGQVNDLWTGEMWMGRGFDIHPSNQAISISNGKCYLGVAPAIVRKQPEVVLATIKKFIRTKPEYGAISYPLIANSRIFHVQIDPSHTLLVCSTALEEIYLACGVQFPEGLAVPSDFDSIVAGTEELEEG